MITILKQNKQFKFKNFSEYKSITSDIIINSIDDKQLFINFDKYSKDLTDDHPHKTTPFNYFSAAILKFKNNEIFFSISLHNFNNRIILEKWINVVEVFYWEGDEKEIGLPNPLFVIILFILVLIVLL